MVIIAILALLVLAVLMAVFLGRLGIWNIGVSSCTDKQGICAPECGNPSYRTENYKFPLPVAVAKCPDLDGEPQKCCSSVNPSG